MIVLRLKYQLLNILLLIMAFPVSAQGPVMEKKLQLKNGPDLLYSCCKPEGINKKQPVPLVIALHWGWNQDEPLPEYFSKSFLTGLVLPSFEQSGAIIVAPDCPSDKWHNEESEAAVLELMDHIRQKYNIDTGQVFITGFSAGGFGTWYMASRHPDKFSMAIPVASKPYEKWVEDWKDLPLFIVNGTQDELFPFAEIEKTVEVMDNQCAPIKLIKVQGATHYDTGKYISSLKYSLTWFRSVIGER